MTQVGCCKICGQALFTGEHVLQHDPTEKGIKSRGTVVQCTSVFLDEFPEKLVDGKLIEDESEESKTEGKFKCPKCDARVGHWNWSGSQCSCGAWVTPAFQITSSKIDIKSR